MPGPRRFCGERSARTLKLGCNSLLLLFKSFEYSKITPVDATSKMQRPIGDPPETRRSFAPDERPDTGLGRLCRQKDVLRENLHPRRLSHNASVGRERFIRVVMN